MRLKIEQEALKKESDAGSKERLKRLEKELADAARSSRPTLTATLEGREGQAVRRAEAQDRARRRLRIELANAQRRGEYQRAGELAYGQHSRAREAS